MPKTTIEEAKDLLAHAQREIPELTRFGVGVFSQTKVLREVGPDGLRKKVEEGRQELADHLDEIAMCADWAKLQQPTKAINRRHSSYGYKHHVESWCRKRNKCGEDLPTYFANGSFIAAAVGLGFEFNRADPNVYFNFSERTVKAPRKSPNVEPS
jgi:hypothetical protein